MGAVKLRGCGFRRVKMSFSLSKLYLQQKHFQQKCRWLRTPASVSFICEAVIFALALASLFSGSLIDLDLYQQQFLRRSSIFKMEERHAAPINIWKSKAAKFYRGCANRGLHFSPAVRERMSNGYLLIAASGGLNQQRV